MASSSATETSPLIEGRRQPPAKPQRTVTFNTTVSKSDSREPAISPRSSAPPSRAAPSGAIQPALSTLNSKLRRRHSHGAPLSQALPPAPKIGAQRTTKHAQKLKLLPDPEQGEEEPDEESGREVYSQFTRIKDPMARRDAARLGKDDREKLPRVTAYCTANAYRLDDIMKFLRGRGRSRGAAPKLFDECIYTPYRYFADESKHRQSFDGQVDSTPHRRRPRRYSDSAVEIEEPREPRPEHLIDVQDEPMTPTANPDDSDILATTALQDRIPSDNTPINPDFDTHVHTPEVFLFNYGTVVIWGMTVTQEQRFLKEIAKFETEKLGGDDIQEEHFNFYYTREYQARIYNDFISLRDKKNYMTKLAISHALSQSVKTSLYEDLVDNTIEVTKDIPSQLATTGKTGMSRQEIAMQIGELFILRINIHLQGSVLDSPELMWAEPGLEPIYTAVRSYLELDSRCGLLTERLDVIADLLAVLKDQSSHRHGEFLEWIVIVLIAAEIIVAAINIVVDLYAGVD